MLGFNPVQILPRKVKYLMENKAPETATDECLPWHKPEVQKLTVNLDTAIMTVGLQSSADLASEG